MDKELFQLLAEAAVKLQSESNPLIKGRQLSKSPTVRAYGNVVNQGDDLFADILYKYLNGEVEVDEAVRKLNNREGTLIKAGNFYKRLEGHHPIYQKLLANRLFNADPKKALEVIKIIRDQLPGNLSPGTDPDKLIYTTRDLHGIIGHGGNFKSNTQGLINTEVTPKEIVNQLYPDLVDAVYRAGYLQTNPAQQSLMKRVGEAFGVTDPDKQSSKVRQSLAKQSTGFPHLPSQLEGVAEATARVVPPDPGNALRILGTNPNLSDVEALGKYRGGQNIGMNLMPDPRSALRAIKENPRGAAAGVAMSALNPEVAQAVEQNNFGQAGLALGKDVVLGATGEAGLKAGLGVASKYIPAVAKAAPTLAKIGGVVGPAATGAALFAQGQSGSLTDVLTRKAAQNPISFMPAAQANPETDFGARASRAIVNEAKYFIINPLQRAFKNVFGNREI
jgi:hypothetical protein